MRSSVARLAFSGAAALTVAGVATSVVRSQRSKDTHVEETQKVDESDAHEKVVKALRAEAVKVGPATIELYVKAPGVVDFHPKHALRIHPAYSGVVVKVNRSLGGDVKAGDVLATIESNQGIQTYALVSPIKGVVLSRNVGEGQSVAPEDELFSVGDASVLQARLSVAARDVTKVKSGLPVLLVSDDEHFVRATVTFLTPVLSEDSRTATALVDFASPEALPGMFVTGAIAIGKKEVPVAVPVAFCSGIAQSQLLFVLAKETIEERAVQIGIQDYEHCEILRGLAPGDQVLPPASLAVLAESEKHEHEDE